MKKKKGFWALNIGLLYILPWLVGFLLFKVYPFASSLYYSFTNYDLFNGITKTGLLNYEKIFTDEDIIRAFVVTFKYAIFDVPLKLAFALFIAYILNFKLIYNNAFLRHKMGMASAQAWILFLIVMTLTAVAFISQKKWVYYSDEEGR